MSFLKDTWKIIRFYKEGILIGAGVGAVAAWYMVGHGYDLTTLTGAGKGLLDTMMSRSAPLEIATTKIYATMISLGAGLGLLIDFIIMRFRK